MNLKPLELRDCLEKLIRKSFIAFKELLLGLMDAKKIIKEFKPDVVIGTGGYVCGPVVYMASRKKISYY